MTAAKETSLTNLESREDEQTIEDLRRELDLKERQYSQPRRIQSSVSDYHRDRRIQSEMAELRAQIRRLESP